VLIFIKPETVFVMKSNRIIWGIVSIVVLFTVAVSFGPFKSSGQNAILQLKETPTLTPTPELKDTRDLSMYGSVNYSAAPENASSARFSANKRYDDQDWVYKSVHPVTGGVGRIMEDPPPPLYPVDESELVATGEVTSVKAFLSNDRGCVYTEFSIGIDELLKNNESGKETPKKVTADREGGVVIYPNGQRVLYGSSDRSVPQLGRKYLFFLRKSGSSPNYEVIASYDITGDRIYPMESGRDYDEFRRLDKTSFLETARNKVIRPRKQ
jgi:hypothetical protein